MPASEFTPTNNTFYDLMARGSLYQIPRFQRDYSWDLENWEDLWADILDILNAEEDAHYMGYLVLQKKPENKLDIIDGQQRMTTLSILVLAAMRKIDELIKRDIDKNNNEKRMELLRSSYVGHQDAATLVIQSKLRLNRNNDNYYQDYIVRLRDLPRRGFKASEHKMRKANDWFFNALASYLEELDINEIDTGAKVAELVDKLSKNLFFTVITVEDELNAYKVFETLNARGVKLSAPDLLKNYLFSVIHKGASDENATSELDHIEKRWSAIMDRLQSENTSTFLRTYWLANHALVRQSELFKKIKNDITTREDAYKLIDGLEDVLDSYISLNEPNASDWNKEDKELALTLKMFSVRQPIGLLMSIKQRMPSAFTDVLNAIVNLSFRYNVVANMGANEQERVYSRVAIAVSQRKLKTSSEVLNELKSIYPSDKNFKASFEDKVFDTNNVRNKEIVRYILAKLDAQKFEKPFSPPSQKVTIEHILPENPNDNWPQFGESSEEWVYRIGNMALLEKKLNEKAANLPYVEKKKQFEKSKLDEIKDIVDNFQCWDEEAICQRQHKQSDFASSIWRISQLS